MSELSYRLHETVISDTRAFRREVEKFLSGETSAVAFRGIRVPMGIYEQRENDTYMVRIRGAAGVFLPHQVKLIADLARIYGDGIVHVTTRQDLQIHNVKIEDTPTILERLLEVGLASRGGGGNTVRNISACPQAGICRDEVFDVTPYALALTEYLIRERGNFNLPRKFKVAFSGCSKDCGLASVADLGFFAHERDGARGFAVYAGGGMGAHSALGVQVEEFIAAESVFEVAEAIKRLFDKHGDRANRSKARLRFVIERLGVEGFRQAYRDELSQVRLEKIAFPEIRAAAPDRVGEGAPDRDTWPPALQKWIRDNVMPQRQDGLCSVNLRLPMGNIASQDLRTLANAALTLGDATIRTTQQQDLQIRGVREADLPNAHLALQRIEHVLQQAQCVRCVACAGASTCKLGLCLSRGLAAAAEARLKNIDLPFDVVVRISGCPNSCGQHPISPLGLYGGASRVNGKLLPVYNIVAGGHPGEGNAALAELVGKVPAKAVPDLLEEFWKSAAANAHQGESVDHLMSRWGIGHLRELVKRYEDAPPYEQSPDFYRDFGCSKDFSLSGRGPGECGAGVSDAIALDIDEAKRALKESRLYDAVVSAARALLVTRGLDPKKNREVFAAFSEHLVVPRWMARGTQDVLDAAVDVELGNRDNLDDLREQVEAMVARVEELFLSLDSNLNFRVQPIEDSEPEVTLDDRPPTTELDLRGVACPMNFVRAKIQLEEIEIGQVLEILLDAGEPVRNVPASFAEQGQEILAIDDEDSHYRVSVRRKS